MARISELRPTHIINAAAYTAVDGAEADRDSAFAVNESAVRTIALAAKAVDATLVHYSTDYVFPGSKKEGYSEDKMPGPAVNVYGESKLEGERALEEIAPTYYLVRTAWLYGPNGKNFVNTMLARGAEADATFRVVNDQRGCPTYTKDVALFTKVLLDEPERNTPGIYHAVNSGVASWYEFAQEIFRIAGMDVRVEPVATDEFPRPARRPQYSVLKQTKGPPLRAWQEALDDYIKQYKLAKDV